MNARFASALQRLLQRTGIDARKAPGLLILPALQVGLPPSVLTLELEGASASAAENIDEPAPVQYAPTEAAKPASRPEPHHQDGMLRPPVVPAVPSAPDSIRGPFSRAGAVLTTTKDDGEALSLPAGGEPAPIPALGAGRMDHLWDALDTGSGPFSRGPGGDGPLCSAPLRSEPLRSEALRGEADGSPVQPETPRPPPLARA